MSLGQGAGVAATEIERRVVQRCEVWGVLNVTPDSFSDGGRYLDPQQAVTHGRALLHQGADVLDVGGASSRPAGRTYGQGAALLSAEEEIARVVPVVSALVREFHARVSIDTIQAEVAAAAIESGASVVNDVSCGAHPALLAVAAERRVEYVLMHTRGRGEVAPPNTLYDDVVGEVVSELLVAVDRAVAAGISRSRIWIDPGIGFAKTPEQSIALLAHTEALLATGLRVLCGPSRKSFIAATAPLASGEAPSPAQREAGTAAAVTMCVLSGAHAVRVHDVLAGRQAVLIAEALRAQRSSPC